MVPREILDELDTVRTDERWISIVGSMNADYTVTAERLPKPGETIAGGPLRILPGGKSGNQAASAARIGASVRMYGSVGSDANADFLLDKLAEAGVDTDLVKHSPGPSGTTVITVDQRGENTIVYSSGSNARVDTEYVDSVTASLLASKVLGLCLESPIEAVTRCARLCHDAGIPVLLNNSPFQPTLPKALIEASDILLVNEHEMAQMLGVDEPADNDWDGADWQAIAERMRDLGFSQAIVTLGADGSVVLEEDGVVRIGAANVEAVDTTGSGDAYMGTILAGLAAGKTLEQSARMASYVSAYAATRYGAQASYGTAAQIREYFLGR